MRRMAIAGALVGIGLVVVRTRGIHLHERVMARCEAMFEQMPDTFPPRKMMAGIEELQVTTSRILALLEAGDDTAARAGLAATAGGAEGGGS